MEKEKYCGNCGHLCYEDTEGDGICDIDNEYVVCSWPACHQWKAKNNTIIKEG